MWKRFETLRDRWIYEGFDIKYVILGKDIYVDIWNSHQLNSNEKLNIHQINLESGYFGLFYGYPVFVVSELGVMEIVPDLKKRSWR